MATWTPELEKLIRAVGEYAETQMKDILNPKASVIGTTLRALFRAVASDGGKLVPKACRQAGYEFKGPGFSDLQGLVDLAEQNDSTAAEKIKKVISTQQKLTEAYHKDPSIKGTPTPADIFRRVKVGKRQGIQY
ncbi:MAG: hypothetical protein HY052_08670 [Proteobacteria bacterium]|nr:hypothetical protein [Pseudomonadota bacterium]